LAGLVNKKPAEIVASLQLMKLSDKSKEFFEAGTIDTSVRAGAGPAAAGRPGWTG
jgi:hypothetical protein